jgi:hypothetical protein
MTVLMLLMPLPSGNLPAKHQQQQQQRQQKQHNQSMS